LPALSGRPINVRFLVPVLTKYLYALSAWGGFLNSQKIDGFNAFFGKLVDLGSAALRVYVMYQNISEWLTVGYLIAYSVFVACILQLLEKRHLGLFLEVIVMHSPYAQMTFVNALS